MRDPLDAVDFDHWFVEYFANERVIVWDRECEHLDMCNCRIWDRSMRDLETYSEGKLQIVHFGNKLNIGGCNACSSEDGRGHHFDKVTAWPGTIVVSCDCLYYDRGRPEGCTCPIDGYDQWVSPWEEEE